jgi:hypothetical protein
MGKTSAATTPYPQKGSTGFDTSFNSIISKTNPTQGSGFKALSKTFYLEGEYDFGFLKWMQLEAGAKYNVAFIENNEWNTGAKIFHDVNAYVNASKAFWKEHFLLFATGNFNYTTDFNPRGDYRAGIMFKMEKQTFWLSSASGYMFPTLAQRYMYLNDYYVETQGNKLASGKWYTGASLQDYQQYYAAYPNDLTGALNRLQTYEVSDLKPQTTKSLELVTLHLVNPGEGLIRFNTALYYHWIRNTQALADLVNPNMSGAVNGVVGQQSGLNNIISGYYTPFNTWTTLPIKTNSWGVFAAVNYYGWMRLNPYINYYYMGHKTISNTDPALVAFNDFNSPMHKLNVGISDADIWHGLGFSINWRWTAGYNWQTDFIEGYVPSYHTLDATIQYNIPRIYSILIIGGNNLYNNRHIEIPGAPKIGAWYYLSWKIDIELKNKYR